MVTSAAWSLEPRPATRVHEKPNETGVLYRFLLRAEKILHSVVELTGRILPRGNGAPDFRPFVSNYSAGAWLERLNQYNNRPPHVTSWNQLPPVPSGESQGDMRVVG